MKYTITLLIALAMLLVTSCGNKEETGSSKAKLTGSFKVNFMGDMDVSHVQPTLVFNSEEKKLSGFAGCNRYTAIYTATDTEILISNIATTRMACAQGMDEERTFVETLERINRYTIEKDRVMLFNDDTVLLKAQKLSI